MIAFKLTDIIPNVTWQEQYFYQQMQYTIINPHNNYKQSFSQI